MSEEGSIYVDDDHGGKETMHKAVSVMHLAAISFFYVCAGPFGQGEAIAAGGAKWTFVFTLLIPLIFSVPLALISSEQASRMPMCGGCNEWGFILGDFMGYTNVYVRTMCSIFDNPIYPVMACDYLAGFIPALEDNVGYRAIVVVVVNAIVIVLNISGLEAVGVWSFLLTFVIIVPFLLFFCFGARFMTVDLVFAEKPEGVDWSMLVSTLIWQYSGFDTVAALAEETKNPKRTFPLGLGITIILVTLVYLLPTISGLSVQPDLSQWASAGFGDIAYLMPYCENGWLSHWINVAGVLSALSLLNVAVSCTGRETYAGGLFNAFPFSGGFFSKLHRNLKKEKIPICSLVFMSVLTIPFSFFDFNFLVEWSGLLTVIQQLIQVAAFIACRFPKCVARMKRERVLMAARVEQVELSSLDAQREVAYADQENLEAEEKGDEMITDDNDLKDKFIIPGGWVGVTITLVPIVACSIFLCVVTDWMSLVISVAMVAALWLLKGIDWGVRKLIERSKRNKARRRRQDESEAVPAEYDETEPISSKAVMQSTSSPSLQDDVTSNSEDSVKD